MIDIDAWAAADHPIEHDCEGCGAHHVIDPDQVRALLAGPNFTCWSCQEALGVPLMRAFTVEDDGTVCGICPACARRFRQIQGE